jgi:methylated-DNA-protein-cysteine methyltransferase related protein
MTTRPKEIRPKHKSKKRASTPEEWHRDLQKRIHKDGMRKSEFRDDAFMRVILSIPRGKVATYGQVATAAGYPLYSRAVASFLRRTPLHEELPWQRVIGAGGDIKLPGAAGEEQRLRLKAEGVHFLGKRVDIERHQYEIRTWEL